MFFEYNKNCHKQKSKLLDLIEIKRRIMNYIFTQNIIELFHTTSEFSKDKYISL